MSFFFTQSNIKDFENTSTCPFRWKSQWVDGVIKSQSNDNLDKGKYFEWLLLGGGAITGEDTIDLPRLKNGEKSVDQIRIEAQAERGKRLFDPTNPEFLGFHIIDTQVEVKTENGRKGTFDVVAKNNDQMWVLDIKLTKDLTSDRTKYGWGNDWQDLDLLQQVHYESLYEYKYNARPKMGLLVFDYSPNKRIEFGEIVISERKRIEKEERFQAAEEAFKLYEKNGWIKIPSLIECENCPLKCDKRNSGAQIVKKIIQY